MRYWLMKTEPNVYSIDDLKKEGTSHWEGVRNYQARNFMRDDMRIGDLVIFYHSNAKPSGAAGIAKVCSEAYPDFTAFDQKSKYYSPKSTPEKPIWMMVDVEFVAKFPNVISLQEIRDLSECHDMLLLQKGQRLSILPIEKRHFNALKKASKDSQ